MFSKIFIIYYFSAVKQDNFLYVTKKLSNINIFSQTLVKKNNEPYIRKPVNVIKVTFETTVIL